MLLRGVHNGLNISKRKNTGRWLADPFLWQHEQTMGWLLLVARWQEVELALMNTYESHGPKHAEIYGWWTMHDVTTGCNGWVSMIYLIHSVLQILEKETLMPTITLKFMFHIIVQLSHDQTSVYVWTGHIRFTNWFQPSQSASGTRPATAIPQLRVELSFQLIWCSLCNTQWCPEQVPMVSLVMAIY